jgi:hypothetical protein
MHLVEMKRHLSNFNGDIAGKPSCAEPERKKSRKFMNQNKFFLDGPISW